MTASGAVPPSPLCSTRGARGLYAVQGVREDVLHERKDDVVGLWTQTLLARDELDGWSGLRPYDFTSSGPVEGNREGQRKKVEFPTSHREGDVVLGGLTPVRTSRGLLGSTFERAHSVNTHINWRPHTGLHDEAPGVKMRNTVRMNLRRMTLQRFQNVVGTIVMRSETSGNILCRLTARHWRTTPCGSARREPVHTEYFHSGGATL